MKDLQGLVNVMPFKSYEELEERVTSEILSAQRKMAFNLLKERDYTDVSELMKDLNGSKNEKAVKKMLQRLKHQLLDSLFFIDISKKAGTLRHRKISEAYKKYAALKILEQWGDTEAFNDLAHELILQAKKYEIDDLIMLLSERLEYYYSFVSINEKMAKKYGALYDESLESLKIRRLVSKLYYEFTRLVIAGKRTYSQSFLSAYSDQMRELQKILAQRPTSFVTSRIQTTRYLYALLKREFRVMLQVCDEALEYFKIKKNYSIPQIFIFQLRKGVAYLYMENYEMARPLIIGLDEFNPTPGYVHWNSAKSYQFMLEMITKRYQEAADILISVVTERSYRNLDFMWVQQWNIRSAYIHFLHKINKISLESHGKKRIPNFRLARFLNEVPLYSKDKRGMNISIILAQFLILLADRRYEEIADRIEALNKYSYRHLKNDYRLRSNCFIRMLMQLPRANYHPIRAQRYAERYVKKLSTTKLNLSEFSTEIEIIPYEQLWQIIIELLAKRSKVKLRI